MNRNKKTVGSGSVPQNQLEKSYEKVLLAGNTVRTRITITLDEYRSEDSRQVLKEMAECARNFYLELGGWLNNML